MTDGVALCTATGDQRGPTIVSDAAGGAIVTWHDQRSGTSDIYAQRVNASGAVQWMTDGVALCTATGDHYAPQITSDGAGGAIITWLGGGSGNLDIYAQRVNASGAVQWTTDGVALCTATGNQEYPTITSDGAGGAIVTWMDHRSVNEDIYAQRVNASGAVQWTINGVAVCTATGDQSYPTITSDGAGGAIVAWEDHRCSSLIYAQRIRVSGEIVSTLLQDYAAAPAARGIRINWSLSEIDGNARFSILRASAPDWQFVELESVAIDKNGLLFACTDESCLPGSTYKYRVECEVEGTARRILLETDAITMPAIPLTLYQNHPNPFNPQTVIRFYLPEAEEIFLDVYNVAGERVVRLAEGKRPKGYHEARWNGRNSSGTVCSSGVYFSRLKAGKSTISRKMVIMR
jgi:predicted lipoprotein with Yx(FWY)xxD motif